MIPRPHLRRLILILCLTALPSCFTPMLWSGSLISDPVTTLVDSRFCRLESMEAGFHVGEPVLLLRYHERRDGAPSRKLLLISNKPPTEESSPFFLALKPEVHKTLEPSELSLRLLMHRYKGSTAPPEELASIGLRGVASRGPQVVVLPARDVPASLRRLSGRRITQRFEPKVQTLIDRFSHEFQLPGEPDKDDRGTWTPLAWIGPKGEVLEDKVVDEAISEIRGLTDKTSGIVLLGRRLSGKEGRFIYVSVGLEYLILLREIRWTGRDGADQWTLHEKFRVRVVPESFELDKGERRILPSPDIDFFENEYETTKGAVSDSLITKILLTPVAIGLDTIGVAFWLLFNANGNNDPLDKLLKGGHKHDKWKKVR